MRATLRKYLPFSRQLEGYDQETFKGDVAAGITVGVMLIPQGMAYALIAGLPPIHGLYAALIPPLLYALVGSSRHLSVGPTALVSLLVAAGVEPLAGGNVERYVVLAACLAVLVGIIQMVMGLIRFGVLADFISEPVLTGFSAAAAILIGVSQLEHLIGVSLPQSEYVYVVLVAAIQSLGDINGVAFSLGIGGILLIQFLKWWNRALPASLLAVVLSSLLVWCFDLQDYGVEVVGDVPAGLPLPSFYLFVGRGGRREPSPVGGSSGPFPLRGRHCAGGVCGCRHDRKGVRVASPLRN